MNEEIKKYMVALADKANGSKAKRIDAINEMFDSILLVGAKHDLSPEDIGLVAAVAMHRVNDMLAFLGVSEHTLENLPAVAEDFFDRVIDEMPEDDDEPNED